MKTKYILLFATTLFCMALIPISNSKIAKAEETSGCSGTLLCDQINGLNYTSLMLIDNIVVCCGCVTSGEPGHKAWARPVEID